MSIYLKCDNSKIAELLEIGLDNLSLDSQSFPFIVAGTVVDKGMWSSETCVLRQIKAADIIIFVHFTGCWKMRLSVARVRS